MRIKVHGSITNNGVQAVGAPEGPSVLRVGIGGDVRGHRDVLPKISINVHF